MAWAGDRSPNLGVRVLGRGSADFLKSVWPDIEIEFVDFGQRPDAMPWGRKRSLLRERVTGRAGMMDWLSRFDVYWDTRSGDSFTDIYGLDRHMKMSLIHEFAVQAGARAILAPQTIGPFETRRGRAIARRSLHRSSLVFARDPKSAAASSELGRPVDATASDLVFAIQQPAESAPSDVLLNVSGLLWDPNTHVNHERYRATTRGIIDHLLSSGREVTLLPHVIASPNHDSDINVCAELYEEYGGRVELRVPDSLESAREIIASSQLVIAARMHACLNAISTGVPAIALSYSRKFLPLLGAIGWSHVVSLKDSVDPTAEVVAASQTSDLRAQAIQARDAGQASLDRVADALRESL